MNRFKSVRRLLITLLLLLSLVTVPALASGGDTVEISTAEGLMELLSTSYGDCYKKTYGKTFVLTEDITIDTSELETSFNANSAPIRAFDGIFDGGGHTVTVVEAESGEPSMPLFDWVGTNINNDQASIRNLDLVFEGNVSGAPLAAVIGNGAVENVNIEFQKDILFANAMGTGYYAVASGVFVFVSASSGGEKNPTSIKNVSVSATGPAPYGVIGSVQPQDRQYVMAAGVYSEYGLAGAACVLEGVEISVRAVCARSSYASSTRNSAVCAAGAVSGHYQSNLRLGYTTVTVAESILSEAVSGSSVSEVYSCGLASEAFALRECSVSVGGSIQAIAAEGVSASAYAAGLGLSVSNKYNQQEPQGGAYHNWGEGTGKCSVTVGGDILASVSSAVSDKVAAACGAAYNTGHQYVWNDVTIDVAGSISARGGGLCKAYASGFAHQPYNEPNVLDQNVDYENCSVTAGSISAVSPEYGGYAAGFMRWCYGACKNCSVTAGSIESSGIDADVSGFARRFSPNTSAYLSNTHGELDGCKVAAGSIRAVNTDPDNAANAAGFVIEVSNVVPGFSAAIRGCEVTIENELLSDSADGMPFEALFVGVNKSSCGIFDNRVTLPRSQADVQTIEGADYVLFTASEAAGRADSTDWQSGNRVVFPGESINAVTCAFDDGDSTGTLWKLTLELRFFTVGYDLNGGTPAPGVDYSAVTVNEGEKISLPAAPEREDYKFIGWSDGTELRQPGDEVEIEGSTTFTAQWEADIRYFTLTYNSNGGTEYPDETYPEGIEVRLDKLPEREGHSFTGWYADVELTQLIETVIMNEHISVYAGWEKDEEPWVPPYIPPVEPEEPVYEPNWLNTTDHFGYIIGYEDGTIKPDASITRAEVATIFFRLLTDEARDKFWTETNSYSDVAETAWYNNAVSTLSRMGILGGYEDGTFRPNASITRAEFAKIAVSFFEYEDISAENIFTDVAAGSWYENFVAVAAKLGLIEGYAGNVYRPNESITRAEACTIINRTLGRAPDADHLLPESQMNTWPDNRPGTWYYAQLQEATNSHEYKWSGDIEHWTAKLPERDWDALQ